MERDGHGSGGRLNLERNEGKGEARKPKGAIEQEIAEVAEEGGRMQKDKAERRKRDA